MTFQEALAKTNIEGCKYARWQKQQHQNMIAEISQAIANVGVHRTFLALKQFGMPVSESTFYNHQTGNCKCN